MGLTSIQFQRFMGKVDATLTDLFPGTISLGGTSYACTAVGGDAAREFLDMGGQAPTGQRVFRVKKSLLATRPETGTQLTWAATPGSETALTVIECPDRPHETSWVIRCAPRNR